MTPEFVLQLISDVLLLSLKVAGPLLGASLIVGVVIGILQAATQVNEMTVPFVFKLAALGITILFAMPWMLDQLCSFTIAIFELVAQGGAGLG